MKISLAWLSDYIEVPPVDELQRRLTMAGLEVEAVHDLAKPLAGVVVAKVLTAVPHPNADKLQVTTVDAGAAGTLQIVCGAKNFKVGDHVPLATVGTSLPNGVTIQKAALRGVDSAGMLCSSKELGQPATNDGLLILDPATVPGTPIAKVLGVDDVVLELNVTPNRPDALSHLGIARELSAILGRPLKPQKVELKESATAANTRARIKIEDLRRCPRYAARVVEGVEVKPSPAWMQRRLEACGVRAINNLVDITNYVLLETGQPLHAFDLDRIAEASIVVRTAKSGEKLRTLDDKERALDSDDLVICDARSPLVLAGVMGGQSSEVSAGTKRVLIECAHFEPSTVRRASKRHGLSSESSQRFERGTDISAIPHVLDRTAALMAELAGGQVLNGRVDEYPTERPARRVTLKKGRVSESAGVGVPEAEVTRILSSLGFADEKRTDHETVWVVPHARVDVSGPEDLVEEVVRVIGLDSVPAVLPASANTVSVESPSARIISRIHAALLGDGFDEAVNYSFVSAPELEAFGVQTSAIAIRNPISAELGVMRTTLLPSLVANISRSARHQAQGVRLYEIARSYGPNASGGEGRTPAATETHLVAGALWGERDGRRVWTQKDARADFYDAKGAVERVLGALRVANVQFRAGGPGYFHPGASAEIYAGETRLGVLGELHPRVQKSLDAPAGIVLFELNLEALMASATLIPQASPLSNFPSVRRDLAVVVDSSRESAAVRAVVLEVGAPLLTDARVFDVYEGKPIPEGKKNLAFALEYRSADKTLTDAEVQAAHDRIVKEVNARLGGALRE